jgi:O-acetyl-ADP-ribose deacetylase
MKISIVQGNITKIKADAIVNAANSTLLGGGGVDGAIHQSAGPKLYEECLKLRKEKYKNGLDTGEAVATRAYGLDAKVIIHTVGPIYPRQDANLLKNCYLNSLQIAEENECRSIAFPAISAGAYGMPIELSAQITREALSEFQARTIEEVILVLFSRDDYNIYNAVFGG